jgi:osmotically-inducible protein OsmY
VSDQQLEIAVVQALADHPRVHPDEIAVQAQNGDVTLRGTVPGPLERETAVRAARAVPGVVRVEDRLRVRPVALDARDDVDVTAAVIQALVDDDQVPADDIEVKTREGTVTLRGLVELSSQRQRAARIALGVGGVERVVNRLKVWLEVSADDVATRITDALGDDAVIGIEQVNVSVHDNDVTLTGWVTSPEHHAAALAAAAGAPGVAGVHDEISIRTPRD